jgi:hypothetical protein
MDSLQRLVAFDEIKQLKARYWRGVDLKDRALFRSVFTDNAEIDMTDAGGGDAFQDQSSVLYHPKPDDFVEQALNTLKDIITAHHGYPPEITLLSPTEATAIWPMEDHLWADHGGADIGFNHLHGFGHYYDRYVKTDDGWKIAAMTLKRSKVIVT